MLLSRQCFRRTNVLALCLLLLLQSNNISSVRSHVENEDGKIIRHEYSNNPWSNSISSSLNSFLRTSPKRVRMHTFYSPLSSKPDLELLDTWKRLWFEAGWDPVVLTVEDAKRHKDYKMWVDSFDSADYKVNDYNRMCFIRWLAMAATDDGGWMSDYDTFPLYSKPEQLDLPNDGKFTCYSGHVPNLVSGSLKEWNRMSKLLFMSYQIHSDGFWSDMRALLEINKNLDAYRDQMDSIALEAAYRDELKKYKKVASPFALGGKCTQFLNRRAIHFSHSDCDKVGFCAHDRKLAYKWIKEWEKKCAYYKQFISLK